MKTEKKIKDLKEELGGIVYAQRSGNPPENADAESRPHRRRDRRGRGQHRRGGRRGRERRAPGGDAAADSADTAAD